MKIKNIIVCVLIGILTTVSAFSRQYFDKNKDLLVACYDLKPDEDDVMAAAAFACMLQHSDLAGVKYIAVAGAYGDQGGSYITTATPGLYNTLFGSNWTDAHGNRNNALNRVRDMVVSTLNAGGKVFIAEAGQSNFSYDMLQRAKNSGISASVIKSRVIAVQHSDWNEDKTTGSELNWMKNNTDYNKIADGNKGGNGTPQYKSNDTKWLNQAQASSNPNAKARQFWSQADDVLDAWNPSWSNPTIDGGGVDYSDCVEMWWIFNIGSNADNVSKFWSRYVINSTGGSGGGDTGGGDTGGGSGNTYWEEKNGLVVIEAENGPLTSTWAKKTAMSGYTGSSYIEYTGANRYGSPTTSDDITYKVKINTAGTYQFKWHSRNGDGAAKTDEENDTWLKIEGDDFYGMKGSTRVNCKNSYVKVWIQNLTAWSWNMNGEHGGVNGFQVYAKFNSPGTYNIKISGRSNGHVIDRMILYLPSASNPQSLSNAETIVNGSGGGDTGGGDTGGGDTGGGDTGGGNAGNGLAPIHDAYLQGTTLYNNNQLRVEPGKRVSYLMFDLGSLSGTVTKAQLKLKCDGDAGNGAIKVEKGNSNNWTESNLSSSNKPTSSGQLGSLNTSYAIGSTYTWNLNAASIATGGKLTLIVTQTSGNDVSFASEESSSDPQLIIETSGGGSGGGGTTDLTSISGPVKVAPGAQASISANYTAGEKVDIKFQLIQKNPWTVLVTNNVTKDAGSGTAGTTIAVPGNATEGAYLWKAWITPSGAGWAGKVDEISQDVTVESGSSGGGGSGQTPYGGANRTIPGTIEAEHYDVGGPDVAYYDNSAGNSGGKLRNDDVDIEARDGGNTVGWTANGEWLEYTLNANAGTYKMEARVAAISTGKKIKVQLGNTTLGTFSVPNTGNWGTFQTIALNNVNVPGGNNQVLRLTFEGGSTNLNWIKFTSTGGSGGGGSNSGEVLTFQAESFTNTSGTYNDASSGGPGLGVNRTATAINFVNNGDWADYNISIPEDGAYEIVYYISSPIDGSTIMFGMGTTVWNTTTVPNNGSWGDYQPLKASQTANFTKGNHVVRLSAGTQTWTWNLDKFTMQRVGAMKDAMNEASPSILTGSIDIYPVPASNFVNVMVNSSREEVLLDIINLQGAVVLSRIIVAGELQRIDISNLIKGMYMIRTSDNQISKMIVQ